MGNISAIRVGLCALALVAAGSVPAVAAAACPAEHTRDTDWIGLSELRGGKGYADTPMGQVHYRLTGEGSGPVIVLLHQTPWSMVQYGEVQACLSARGVRSLAIDTPGYGMSDAPRGRPSIDDYADNLVPVLDTLDLDRVIVAGHHTGAAIAAAFAARHPERVSGLLLHGTPLYTAQERKARLTAPEHPVTLRADGSNLSEYYRYIRRYAGDDPRTRVTATWSVLARYLAGAADVAHHAVFVNDMRADLNTVRSPVLILSDAEDSLHENDVRAAKLHSWFRDREFSDGRAHAMMIDPARWARIVAGFVHAVATGSAPSSGG